MKSDKQEKLERFSQVVLREAQIQKGSKMEIYDTKINEAVAKYEFEVKKAAQEYINKQVRKVVTENTKKISIEHVKLIQELNQKRSEVESNIFANVKRRIDEFKESNEYEIWLIELIKESTKDYDPKDIIIYISNSDETLLGNLSKATTAPIMVANEYFIGGIKVVCESKRTVLNSTISEGIKDAKDNLQNIFM